MKTKLTLLATGACVALLLNLAGAVDFENFPDTHLGARHIPFTGTYVHTFSGDGTPTADGYGYRERHGTSELTISVPILGITDLVLLFSTVTSADLDADDNGSTWGTLDGRGGQAGRIHFAGRDHEASDTLATHTRQYGGCFWSGPLYGANLLATEQIEEKTDGEGPVVSTTSVVEGILIVPFYADFAPFDGVDPLPPLKPVTELPAGTGWRTYVVSAEEYLRMDKPIGMHLDVNGYISCAELGIRDLSFPIHQRAIAAGYPTGRRYGEFEFQPTGQDNLVWGRTAFQGMMGYVEGTGKTRRNDFMDHTGVFQTGPLAGYFYVKSHGNSITGSSIADPFHQSIVLIAPDTLDLDLSEPQKMLNTSARGRVGTDDDIVIVGFVVSGKVPRTVLVRAVGATLGEFGVAGFIADPALKVYRSTEAGPTLVGANNNWKVGNDQLAIQAANTKAGAFALSHDSDAALLFSWLEPGAYTAHVSGIHGATGVALVEVYELGN